MSSLVEIVIEFVIAIECCGGDVNHKKAQETQRRARRWLVVGGVHDLGLLRGHARLCFSGGDLAWGESGDLRSRGLDWDRISFGQSSLGGCLVGCRADRA